MLLINTLLLYVFYLLGGASLKTLIGISVSLIFLICSFLLFIIIYLAYDHLKRKRKEALIISFSFFLSEIILAESEDEKVQVLNVSDNKVLLKKWFKSTQARNLLLTEVVKIHQNMSGVAAKNLEWLYEYLQFQNITLKDLAFGNWHTKTIALQQLAEMNQVEMASVIFSHTTNKNKFIREEAQLGMVKLTGFKGLDFLHIIKYRISLWQQLGLLNQLPFLNDNQVWKNAEMWLLSENETVVEFTLRLVQEHKKVEMHDHVIKCLQHTSPIIRKQTLITLNEIAGQNTQRVLKKFYKKASVEEKLVVLNCLQNIISPDLFSFLETESQCKNAAIRNKAIVLIKDLQPQIFHTEIINYTTIKEKQYASN